MESDPHDARIGKIPHWVREAMFIVVSVTLGFALAQFGEERADRRLAAHALTNLRAELEYNQAVLEPMVPIHAKWVEALANADTSDRSQSGIDVFFATRPTLPADVPSPFPFLRRSAWDAALSGGALRLIDYDVLATLSEIY